MDEYKVWKIRAMPNMPRQEFAQELLEDIARQVQPIMIKHKWRVNILSEFLDYELLGVNISCGDHIHIKLRLRYDKKGKEFKPMDELIDTMLHELCHNDLSHNKDDVFDRDFNSLLNSVKEEFNDLRSGSRPHAPHTFYPSNHWTSHAPHTCYPSNHGTRDYPSNHGTYDYPSDHWTHDYPSNYGTMDYPSNHGTWDYPSNHEIYPSNHETYDYPSNDRTRDYPSNLGTDYDGPSQYVPSDYTSSISHSGGDSIDHVEDYTNPGPLILIFLILGMIIFTSKLQIPVLLFVCVACFFFMLVCCR